MFIRCWGSRGSIPVSGESYLKYGGDTTCMEIQAQSGDIVVIDAGTGIRRYGNHAAGEGHIEYHFLFTHAHWDHIMGFPFFRPLYFDRSRIHLHSCPFDQHFVKMILSKVMAEPYFPVAYADIKAEISYSPTCQREFEIGSLRIEPIAISHPNGGSGYKFVENDQTLIFLTDNELGYRHDGGPSFSDYVDFVSGADLLIHDAEYAPEEYRRSRGWGHSVYTDTLDLAVAAGCKRVGLFHLHQERTDADMDQIVTESRRILADGGHDIDCFGVGSNWQMKL